MSDFLPIYLDICVFFILINTSVDTLHNNFSSNSTNPVFTSPYNYHSPTPLPPPRLNRSRPLKYITTKASVRWKTLNANNLTVKKTLYLESSLPDC